MKSTIVVRVGLAIAGVALAASGWAQGPGPMESGPGGGAGMHRPPFERAFGGNGFQGRWWNNPRVIEKLKLTDDQRKQFDQILLEHRESLIDLRANLEKAELKLEPLVRDDQPNETAILAQIDKVAQARAELEKANARYLLALRSKLTPDQWKQVQAFRQGREFQNWGSREHRQGGPGTEGRPPADGQHSVAPPPPGPQGAAEEGNTMQAPAETSAPSGGIEP
jgi:periplasmic protein CpxP/Spy